MPQSPFSGIFNALALQAKEKSSQGVPTGPTSVKIGDDSSAGDGAAPSVGQIAVDIYEVEDYYVIRAPIAGVKLADLDIEVDGKVVTIKGERTLGEEVESEKYFLQECFFGPFSRSITMPCNVDPKKVKATFSKDSILKVIIAKEEKVKIVRVNQEG